MKRHSLVLLALFLVGLPSLALAFTFKIPAGWVDLSAQAPAANFARLAPGVAEQLKAGHYDALAIDLDHADDGFAENFNAIVKPGVDPITQTLLDQIVTSMGHEIAGQAPGATMNIVERGLVTLRGVTCGRMVSDTNIGEQHMRQVMYLLPGKDQHAIVTYSATPATFAAYAPIFAAAVAETDGIVEPPSRWGRIGEKALGGAIIGGLAGALGMLLKRRSKRDAGGRAA